MASFPPVKIIYIVRDPFDRALSQIRMNAERRGISGNGADWLALAREPDIASRGAYATYVPRWEAAFPEEDVLFLPYKRIGNDPAGVMRDDRGSHPGRSLRWVQKPRVSAFIRRAASIFRGTPSSTCAR